MLIINNKKIIILCLLSSNSINLINIGEAINNNIAKGIYQVAVRAFPDK